MWFMILLVVVMTLVWATVYKTAKVVTYAEGFGDGHNVGYAAGGKHMKEFLEK